MVSPKKALITGVTGQDGSYLAELLIEKGYEVHGLRRRVSGNNLERIEHIIQDPHLKGRGLKLHYGDITDSSNVIRLLEEIRPDEIYNFAAQSHVKVSFETPEHTANVDALGPLRLLEAIRILHMEKHVRFYQASTSEMFGNAPESPQSERTTFQPRSPYGTAKLYAHWVTSNYREAYGIFACSGILFNHESPRRGSIFVSRKITQAVTRIITGLEETLYLGNLNAERDWGFAPDYVEATWMMLQQDQPDDYVIATGKIHSVREFTKAAFKMVGIDLEWSGSGKQEIGSDAKTGRKLVAIDPWYFRPLEVDHLIGDATKARVKLGWEPRVGFEDLVRIMVETDLKLAEKAVSEQGVEKSF